MQGYSYINLLRKILKIKKKNLEDKSYIMLKFFNIFLKGNIAYCIVLTLYNIFLFTEWPPFQDHQGHTCQIYFLSFI